MCAPVLCNERSFYLFICLFFFYYENSRLTNNIFFKLVKSTRVPLYVRVMSVYFFKHANTTRRYVHLYGCKRVKTSNECFNVCVWDRAGSRLVRVAKHISIKSFEWLVEKSRLIVVKWFLLGKRGLFVVITNVRDLARDTQHGRAQWWRRKRLAITKKKK